MSNKKIRWLRDQKDKLVAEFLRDTQPEDGLVRVSELLSYIERRPDHPLYQGLFGESDAIWARKARETYLRSWLNGTRYINVVVQNAATSEVRHIDVQVTTAVSPRASRGTGGGYTLTNETVPVNELADQAADSLQSWVKSHAGTATIVGIDLSPIHKIIGQLRNADPIKAVVARHGG